MYLALAALKHVVPVRTLARWMWADPPPAPLPDDARVAAQRVVRIRRVFGRDADCLESSLLFFHELSRAGADPVLCVGFDRRGLSKPGHSWVEVDGKRVGEAGTDEFVPVATFGHGGRQVR